MPHIDQAWSEEELRRAFPRPAADAHKYSRGKLTVIAGSARFPGAALLAARAGQRMGAGYTELVTAKPVAKIAPGVFPSLVARPFDAFDASKLAALKDPSRHAVCVGPGFVAGDACTDELTVAVLGKAACPVLVDGGALAALGSKKALKALVKRAGRGRPTIITPHAGEALRLAKDVCLPSDDPERLCAALALAIGAIVVLKGPDTYISTGKRLYVMREGGVALAKAGTGDVLAGMIAALLAQGADPFDAAVLGATLHARAGNAAAASFTVAGVTPEDVVEAIPVAVRTMDK